ncbi:MAG: hypothetical protein OXH09_22000, partial [Gammaproteobacteria bacterium]|nr:hypothetical protein [Gammaproteobacteria bacterium]
MSVCLENYGEELLSRIFSYVVVGLPVFAAFDVLGVDGPTTFSFKTFAAPTEPDPRRSISVTTTGLDCAIGRSNVTRNLMEGVIDDLEL